MVQQIKPSTFLTSAFIYAVLKYHVKLSDMQTITRVFSISSATMTAGLKQTLIYMRKCNLHTILTKLYPLEPKERFKNNTL